MHWIWRVLLVLIALLVLVLSLLAMVDNAELVRLRLLSWESPALSLYWWLLLALLVGVGLGWLFCQPRHWQLRLQVRQARKALQERR